MKKQKEVSVSRYIQRLGSSTYKFDFTMINYAEECRRIKYRVMPYNRFDRPYLSDESLGGEWGLDASDFGAQAWGDS